MKYLPVTLPVAEIAPLTFIFPARTLPVATLPPVILAVVTIGPVSDTKLPV